MGRALTDDDIEPALFGGLFLSAGGSGRARAARDRVLGRTALATGKLHLATLDEFDPVAPIITATAVGAPGLAEWKVDPNDAIAAARKLAGLLKAPPAGVICGHVPGFNAWLVAAALRLPYVDAASNGRGHPTVKMGGMGLASRPDLTIIQVAFNGALGERGPFSVVAEGDIVRTSNMLRQAAVMNGGLTYAARGPLSAGFVTENAAAGAITFQIELGRAMLATTGSERVQSTTEFLGGSLLVEGTVATNTVTYSEGFDHGQVIVRGTQGEAVLGVYNEFMTADVDNERIATFPDLIGTLDPQSGEPVAISELPLGSEVAVIVAHRTKLPVGKGAIDPVALTEVEKAMGVDLHSYS